MGLLCAALFSGCGTSPQVRVRGEDSPLYPILTTPSSSYIPQLAVIAAELSDAAEGEGDSDFSDRRIREKYEQLGIEGFKSYRYENGLTNVQGIARSGAFAIGQARIRDAGGEVSTVLVITCRGSKTLQEYVGDWQKGGDVTFLDQYRVWKNVYDFYANMKPSVEDYMKRYLDRETTKNLKILVTGHSLGGAAANLVAAWLDSLFPDRRDAIHCYTFNAIKVLKAEQNISTGFENIHNVYNYYDSFGPNGNKKSFNARSPYAKFGHTEIYRRNDEETGSGLFDSCNNHMNYVEAVKNPDEYELIVACDPENVAYLKDYLKEHGMADLPVSTPYPTYEPEPEEPVEPEQMREEDPGWEEPYYGDLPYGTYSDGVQDFTFYNDHEMGIALGGIPASEGTYTIGNGNLHYSYDLFGEHWEWDAPFEISDDGETVWIYGDEFTRVQ